MCDVVREQRAIFLLVLAWLLPKLWRAFVSLLRLLRPGARAAGATGG